MVSHPSTMEMLAEDFERRFAIDHDCGVLDEADRGPRRAHEIANEVQDLVARLSFFGSPVGITSISSTAV